MLFGYSTRLHVCWRNAIFLYQHFFRGTQNIQCHLHLDTVRRGYACHVARRGYANDPIARLCDGAGWRCSEPPNRRRALAVRLRYRPPSRVQGSFRKTNYVRGNKQFPVPELVNCAIHDGASSSHPLPPVLQPHAMPPSPFSLVDSFKYDCTTQEPAIDRWR